MGRSHACRRMTRGGWDGIICTWGGRVQGTGGGGIAQGDRCSTCKKTPSERRWVNVDGTDGGVGEYSTAADKASNEVRRNGKNLLQRDMGNSTGTGTGVSDGMQGTSTSRTGPK